MAKRKLTMGIKLVSLNIAKIGEKKKPLKLVTPEINDLIAEYKAKIKAITGQSSE
jgi:hypothetical protein